MTEIPGRKGTVLIVDDEPNVIWFISSICQPRGYLTITAMSGLEALKIVQECSGKIDVVLLDLAMPGMGGIEVLKAIRKYQPDMAVIILTALHDKQAECESIGIEAFVKKPYILEDLYSQISAVIECKAFDKADVEIDPALEPCAKILIVDDESEVCDILSGALQEDYNDGHFEIKIAHTGDAALTLSMEFEPDIAIVDIKMPLMWGDELIRRFKAGEGHCPKDFIVYTSLSDPKEVERARRLGHKLITKPTNLEILIEALVKICVRHNLLRKKKV